MAGYRILLVDDDPDLRTIFRASLGSKFEIVEAIDGLDALNKLEMYEPDLAILDVMMPVMDGFELCEAIRRHRDFRQMPILFLSGVDSRDQIRKGYDAGANLYLTKPIEPARILKNVEFTFESQKVELRPKRYSLSQLREMTEDWYEQDRPGASPPANEPVGKRIDPASVQDKASTVERAAGPKAKPASSPGITPRIMVVEDDQDEREILNLLLNSHYEVVQASNGMEAVEVIVQYQPDLMLLDLMMPKMNGYQLLKSMRRIARYRTLPIVIISAKSSARDREYALRSGATDFIGKPFDAEAVLKCIAGIVASPTFEARPKKLSIEEIHS